MLLEKVNKSVEFIKSKTSLIPRVSVTLGSGLAHFVENIDIEVAISYSDIPGFMPPTVEGHPGQLILGHVGSTPVAVLQGRVHFYEGHSMHEVVHPTRVLAMLGAETMIITNAAGGLSKDIKPGSFVLLRDQINLTGTNPLIGSNIDEFGPRFPDMSQPYNHELSDQLEKILKQKNIPYINGTYCAVTGPAYETPAEVQYIGKLGGSCVGMSTVPEVIAAVHMGKKVVGISCVTNLGTGIGSEPLSHDDVKIVAKQVEGQFSEFLNEFISAL